MTQLVVGAGEVGTALYAVLSRAHPAAIRDVGPVEVRAEVLHVAIPWQARFVEIVRRYEVDHAADLVVVHSTVPVGTCDPEGWVHSPVRGRHPDLAPALTAFVKHFGGPRAKEAAAVFEAVGCDVMLHDRAAETEAAKLWELTSFGVAVAFEKAVHAWCLARGIDPAAVYTAFRETYNDGYQALGHPELSQPILRHMPGPIGGHCVVPSMAILDHPFAELVVAASREAAARDAG